MKIMTSGCTQVCGEICGMHMGPGLEDSDHGYDCRIEWFDPFQARVLIQNDKI